MYCNVKILLRIKKIYNIVYAYKGRPILYLQLSFSKIIFFICVDRADQWLLNAGRKDLLSLTLPQKNGRRICEKHFSRENYVGTYRRLRWDTVPQTYSNQVKLNKYIYIYIYIHRPICYEKIFMLYMYLN
jgi:hypothetical protein